MKLLALRHLPTAMNRQSVLQGRIDTPILPLDQETRQQIQRNLQLLTPHEPIDVVLTSRLQRTQQTCRAYGYDNFQVEPLLDELDFGHYEGQSRILMEKEIGLTWYSDPTDLVFGESLKALGGRVMQFLEKYSSMTTVLIFAHGAWLRALLSIHHYGNLTHMNQRVVDNNTLHLIDDAAMLPSEWRMERL